MNTTHYIWLKGVEGDHPGGQLYAPEEERYMPIFKHCTEGLSSIIRSAIPAFQEVFEFHGVRLRITDGERML